MAFSKEAVEAIDQIVNFNPEEEGRRDLGQIEEGIQLVWDIFSYQQRAVTLPDQPRLLSWTKQRTLALVGERGAKPLSYAADIKDLREDLVLKVLDRVSAVKQKIAA